MDEAQLKLADLGPEGKLFLVVHTSEAGRRRRMWNAATVATLLRARFPPKNGHVVILWDASFDLYDKGELMAALYAHADVVITGVGLHNLHHVLLKDDAHVVDVETHGVSWEDVEMGTPMHCKFRRNQVSPYQRQLLYAGVLDHAAHARTGIDFATVRAFSDYRVNPRGLDVVVSKALAVSLNPVDNTLFGTCESGRFKYRSYSGEAARQQALLPPLWGAPLDFSTERPLQDTIGSSLSASQSSELRSLCGDVCQQRLVEG